MDLSSISFGMEEELGENNCSGEFLKGEQHRKHNHPMGGCVYDRRKMMDIAVNMPQYIPTFVSPVSLRDNGILRPPRLKQINTSNSITSVAEERKERFECISHYTNRILLAFQNVEGLNKSKIVDLEEFFMTFQPTVLEISEH